MTPLKCLVLKTLQNEMPEENIERAIHLLPEHLQQAMEKKFTDITPKDTAMLARSAVNWIRRDVSKLKP